MIGQMQMLDKAQAIAHWKARGLDFSKLFYKPQAGRRRDPSQQDAGSRPG